MRNRKHELGMTLAEVVVALAIVGIMIFASSVVTIQAHQMTRANSDKEFATQKAISIIEEMKALVQVNANGTITSLDTFDDAANTNPILTIQGTHLQVGDPTPPTQPDDTISGNVVLNPGSSPVLWTYERHITVTTPPGEPGANSVRLVDVQIYKNTLNGKHLLAEVSSVIRTIITSLPPSQVYDVYAIAIENVPGWWVYMSNVVQVVKNAITNLQSRNPGLEFRQHWINTLAYGRDQQYTPYINDAGDSRANIPDAYFYPGKMPDPAVNANVGNNYYYYPAFFRGHVNIDGNSTNGYDSSIMPGEDPVKVNPYPYALADQYNHAMRYQDELNLYRLRDGNNPSEEMTLRLLLEDMYSHPDKYTNALVINLHGELMPFPPIRNYSDAAKDPEQIANPDLRNARVVTHPEQLAYLNSGAPAPPINLRVYSYLTNPDAPGALQTLPTGTPISILIRGTTAWTPAVGSITSIAGPWKGSSTGLAGTAVVYSSNANTPICAGTAPADGTMCYSTQTVGATFQDTLIKLYNSPVRSPLDTTTGSGLDYASRLYNMEYIPSPVEDLTTGAVPFTKDLNSSTVALPKNTARWVISIPIGVLPSTGIITVETRIGDVCPSGNCTSGVLYPSANHPANLSRTYVYRGDNAWLYGDLTTTPIKPPNLPITERYQVQGDPRHCPYADLKRPFTGTTATPANESPLGMGYNRYFDNFEDAVYNGETYTQMVGSVATANVNLTATTNVFAYKVNGGSTKTVTLGGSPPNTRAMTTIRDDLNADGTFSGLAVADVVNGHLRIIPKTTPGNTLQFDTTKSNNAAGVLGFDNIVRTKGAWVGWNYGAASEYGVKNSGALGEQGAAGWTTGGNGNISFDVPRLFQITRSALIRSNALWTTMTGWSYYYVGIGNEIGYDAANGFPNSVPVSTMPFTGATGAQYVDSITNTQGTYLVKGAGAQAGWWSMPWLGELYPDAEYDNGGIDWKDNGNIPTSNATATGYYLRDLRQNYMKFPGTDLEASVSRTWQNGCVTMFWSGAAGSSFRHSGGGSPDTGSIQTAGTDIANHFAFPVPDTMDSNRPFDVNAAAGATPDNFLQNAYVQAGISADTVADLTKTGANTAAVLNTYYSHNSGTLSQSSALLTLRDPTSLDAAFIVVNGLSPTGVSGTTFISNWAFLSLIQSYFNGGLYTDGSAKPTAHHVRQLPRVAITAPNVTTNLKKPSSITITWNTTWQRWDALPYTTLYPGGYSETTGISYQVMYSPSGGAKDPANGNPTGWFFVQTGSQATPGTPTTHPLTESIIDPTKTTTWDVSNTTKYPEANYLIRVEAYRTSYNLHYSYHEFRAYISR